MVFFQKLMWCEALSYFSLGGAQNDSGRFQRESVFGHAIRRNPKELQMANKAVKYYASEPSNELCFKKCEQKRVPRWPKIIGFCDWRICWDASYFEIKLQNALQTENQRFRSNFVHRGCVEFNAAPLRPRGRGPSLRAFLLLAALQIVV